MVKFDSATVVQQKLRAEFGINTPGLTCIKDTFERFCETGTVEDRERSGRPSSISEETIDKVSDALKDKPQSSVRSVATDCSIPPTATHRIMTEYLALKPYKAQFVQQLYEEDLQDRVEMYIKVLNRKLAISYGAPVMYMVTIYRNYSNIKP
ncbi:unnamed protein product [Rotaria socialis]|uniref:Uncharacterized protein n=2 Tax=Rotaria socialis TaxID=392032 RepID=A0A817Z091_9BILA|nr:unnamed protein product [Rotaria socialis]